MPASSPSARYAWRKKPRNFHSKKSTGCRTCKKRRVKCDEEQPACKKCLSTGRTCEGYTADPLLCPEAARGGPVARKQSNPSSSGPNPFALGRSFLHQFASTSVEREAIFFFELQTLPQLDEYHPCIAWAKSVLCFGQDDISVRHALIALSLQHRSHTYGGGAITSKGSGLTISNVDKTALFYYNSAIRNLLKKQRNGNNVDPSYLAIVLFVCYLFICFENLTGNYGQGLAHLKGGISLMQEYRQRLSANQAVSSTQDYKSMMILLAYKFRHMDVQASVFQTGWSPQLLVIEDEVGPDKPDVDPVTPLGRATHMIDELLARVSVWHQRAEAEFKTQVERVTPTEPPEYGSGASAFESERRELLTSLRDFSGFLDALLKEHRHTMTKNDLRLANLLKLHQVSCHIYVSAYGFNDETIYDDYLPKFKLLVEIATDLSEQPDTSFSSSSSSSSSSSNAIQSSGPNQSKRPPTPIFSNEIGILMVLRFVGAKCRDPTTRRSILSLLRSTRRREGPMDSALAERIIETQMAYEKGEDDPEFDFGGSMADIPESRRIRNSMIETVCEEGPGAVKVRHELCVMEEGKPKLVTWDVDT